MTEEIAIEIAAAITAQAPQQLAQIIKSIIDRAQHKINQGDWAGLQNLGAATDAAFQHARDENLLTEPPLALLADMGQQMLVVLTFAAQSQGNSQTGYYRAALTHARRLDAMTQGQLGLELLVESIKTAHQSD